MSSSWPRSCNKPAVKASSGICSRSGVASILAPQATARECRQKVSPSMGRRPEVWLCRLITETLSARFLMPLNPMMIAPGKPWSPAGKGRKTRNWPRATGGWSGLVRRDHLVDLLNVRVEVVSQPAKAVARPWAGPARSGPSSRFARCNRSVHLSSA